MKTTMCFPWLSILCLLSCAAMAVFPALGARRARLDYEPPDPSVPMAAANQFRGAAVTASGQWSDRAPAFAVDGESSDPGEHWGAENLPVWLTVDMGSARTLNAIRLWTYWGDGRSYQYVVEGSLDGTEWRTLADRRGNRNPATSAGDSLTFPPTSVRYVRTTITGSTAGAASGGHIVEIAGYNVDDPAMLARERAWEAVPAGLHGAAASLDVRYPRDTVPSPTFEAGWNGSGWRGERVNAQFVLWSGEAASQLRLEAGRLQAESGGGAIDVSARFVRYVLADKVLMPDILDDAAMIDMPARSTRPVWVSVDIPADARPGFYTGTVTARAAGGAIAKLPLRLEVLPLTLPPPAKWSFHLDLWQNPFAVARYHRVALWSPEHLNLLRPHLRMLADAGAKCLSVSIIDDPWGGQTFDAYHAMIGWTRRKNGSWSYDYSVFDRYVEFGASCGLDKYINCYSMIPWTNKLRYFDEATGDYQVLPIDPKGPEYERVWGPFLTDFTEHLKSKGWLGRTVIAMDERPVELMRPAIAVLHKYGTGLRLALAGDNQPQIQTDIDDWCVIINSAVSDETIRERAARKALTTFYVCTGPERPNTFTYSPPAEAAWLGIYAAARHMSGFLRWAYDSWTEDPLWDTKHVTWQAGDAFLVYPNARSSIRFERLREGIQQYEKIRLLRERAAGQPLPELTALDEALAGFTWDNAVNRPAAEDVNRAEAAIDRLSRALAGKR